MTSKNSDNFLIRLATTKEYLELQERVRKAQAESLTLTEILEIHIQRAITVKT